MSGTSRLSRWIHAGRPADPTFGEPGEDAHVNEVFARAVAPEAVQQHPLFSIVIQPYWTEDLARFAGRTLDLGPAEVEALLKIHELREKARARWKPYRPAGIIATLLFVSGFLLTQVPEEVFGDAYDFYRLSVFFLLLAGLWLVGGFG
jgi:hypothetical protein